MAMKGTSSGNIHGKYSVDCNKLLFLPTLKFAATNCVPLREDFGNDGGLVVNRTH
jgi:hypothetical protein